MKKLEIDPKDSVSNAVPNPKHQCQQLNPFNIRYFWPSNQFVEFQEIEFGCIYCKRLCTEQA